jgi:hypothetical protein
MKGCKQLLDDHKKHRKYWTSKKVHYTALPEEVGLEKALDSSKDRLRSE